MKLRRAFTFGDGSAGAHPEVPENREVRENCAPRRAAARGGGATRAAIRSAGQETVMRYSSDTDAPAVLLPR